VVTPSPTKRPRKAKFIVGRVFRSGPQDRHVFQTVRLPNGEHVTVLDRDVHGKALSAVRRARETVDAVAGEPSDGSPMVSD